MTPPSDSVPSKSSMLRRQGVLSPPDTMITGGMQLAMRKAGTGGAGGGVAPPPSTLQPHSSRGGLGVPLCVARCGGHHALQRTETYPFLQLTASCIA